MKVTLITGLPGSGKTFLAKSYEDKGCMVIDDIRTIHPLEEALKGSKDIVLTDPNFCSPNVRKKVESYFKEHPQISLEWVFFENNAEKCRKNVAYRKSLGDSREVEASIRRFEKEYTIPEDVVPLEIWQGDL